MSLITTALPDVIQDEAPDAHEEILRLAV